MEERYIITDEEESRMRGSCAEYHEKITGFESISSDPWVSVLQYCHQLDHDPQRSGSTWDYRYFYDH